MHLFHFFQSWFRKLTESHEGRVDDSSRGLRKKARKSLPVFAFAKPQKERAAGLSLARTSTLPPERTLESLQEEVELEEALAAQRDHKPRFTINPDSKWKRRWDVALLFLVLYVSYATPLSIGFFSDHQQMETELRPYQADLSKTCQDGGDPASVVGMDVTMDDASIRYFIFLTSPWRIFHVIGLVVDICFWIDLFLTFFTGFKVPGSLNTQYSHKKIAKRYIQGWLLIDFMAVFPLDKVVAAMSAGAATSSVRVDIVQLAKLLRLSRLSKKMEQFTAAKSLRMFYLALLYSTIAHWIACGFFFAGRWQIENLKGGGANRYLGDPWLIQLCLHYANLKTQYVMALYWSFTTMTTVGYGDIVPTTNMDRCFAMIVMLVGGIVQAIIFGNVAFLIQNFDSAKARLRERLGAANEIIRFYDLPEDMAYRITDSVEYHWNISQGLDKSEVLRHIPARMRTDMLLAMQKNFLEEVPVFGEFGDGFLRALVGHFKTGIFIPDDYVVQYGDTGMEMFIIQDGECQVLSANEKFELARLVKGDHFGDIDLILGSRRMANVKTITYCTMYVLQRRDLEKVLAEFPEHVEPLMQDCLRRREELQRLNMERLAQMSAEYPEWASMTQPVTPPPRHMSGTAFSSVSLGELEPNKKRISRMARQMSKDVANEEGPRISFSGLMRMPSGPMQIVTQEQEEQQRSANNRELHMRQLRQQVDEVFLRQKDIAHALEAIEKRMAPKGGPSVPLRPTSTI